MPTLTTALQWRATRDEGDILHWQNGREVHEHGALAGIELVHGGYSNANHYSRIPPIAPADLS